MSTLELSVDFGAVNQALDGVYEDAKRAARPAAQAGAQVLYDQVVRNVDALTKSRTGNLRRAIYQAYMDKASTEGNATYRVSWNKTKAPHGHLVEFGHIQRYKVYLGRDGKFYTRLKPGVKIAKAHRTKVGNIRAKFRGQYYQPLPTPIQHPARPFIRNATAAFPRAIAAMEERFLAELFKSNYRAE